MSLADESICIGPPAPQDSYLNIPAIIAAAEVVDAVAYIQVMDFFLKMLNLLKKF